MRNKILKTVLTTAGVASLVLCIMNEVDGVGRAAMVFFGIICVYLGLFIKEK